MCRQLDNHRWLPPQLTPPCQRSCQVGYTVGTMLHVWTFSLYSPSFSLFPPPPLPPSLLPLPPLSSVKQSAVMEAPLPASEQPPPDLFLASDETAADKSSPTATTQEADGDRKTGAVGDMTHDWRANEESENETWSQKCPLLSSCLPLSPSTSPSSSPYHSPEKERTHHPAHHTTHEMAIYLL